MTGIIVGGVFAAICFGVANILGKISSQNGLSTGVYLLGAGIGVLLFGAIVFYFSGERVFHPRSFIAAVANGGVWALGMFCFFLAMQKYLIPVSQLVPLHGLGILVSVLLAFMLFSEWKELHVPQLLAGATLIFVGAVLVVRA